VKEEGCHFLNLVPWEGGLCARIEAIRGGSTVIHKIGNKGSGGQKSKIMVIKRKEDL